MTDSSRRYWDEVGAEWARTKPQWLWRRHSDAVNTRLLRRWPPAAGSARLLKTDAFDEAVGEGLFPLLEAQARSVVQMDLGGSMVRGLRERHPGALGVVADVRALPFASGSFDAVVSLSTLDHFASTDEIAASLAELRRVLGRDGQLVLTLDNPLNPIVALRNALPYRWLHRAGLVPYQVGATLSPQNLHRALHEAGFHVVASDAVLHAPRVLAVALAELLARWGASRAGDLLLRALMACEVLERLPTRRLTAYFTAVRARASGT